MDRLGPLKWDVLPGGPKWVVLNFNFSNFCCEKVFKQKLLQKAVFAIFKEKIRVFAKIFNFLHLTKIMHVWCSVLNSS